MRWFADEALVLIYKNRINTGEQWKTIQKPLLPYIAENWKYFDAFESSLQIINMS